MKTNQFEFTFYFNLIWFLLVISTALIESIIAAIVFLALGFIQLTLANCINQDLKLLSKKNKTLFKIYKISILIWVLIASINIFINIINYGIILFIVPAIIAIYFTGVTLLIKVQK